MEGIDRRGFSEKSRDLISSARELREAAHPMPLRHLHYAIFSAAKIDYENAQADHERPSRATTVARRAIVGVNNTISRS
jgi:hypothetical protein